MKKVIFIKLRFKLNKMVFGFEFNSPILIYYVGGFKTRKKTMSKLEEISRGHCKKDSLAIGTIYFLDDEKFEVVKKYKIKLEDGDITMEED